jgi:NAD(P)-dependent dehydrogenase (short-subunit alcohol dehydrogenase family)
MRRQVAVTVIILWRMPTLLITGATRGLGLAAARAAAPRADLLIAGRDRLRTERVARELGGEPVLLDLTSLDAVRATVAALPHVDAVACNAGLQLPGALQLTPDGFEETFQVNFLAQLVLVDGLLAREGAPQRVVFVGSATHDPAQRTGMPAPLELDLEGMARGGPDVGGAGRRRYTTSKLLVTALTFALARERPDLHVGCLDPGLMAATGLARHYPQVASRLLSALARPLSLLPFASTPERSGRVLAALLLDDPPPAPSGTVVDHRGRPARTSERARDTAFQDELVRGARELGGVSFELRPQPSRG